MDTTYDPSDQFFQAFSAGLAWADGARATSEPEAWRLYINWLHEDGIQGAAL